MAQLPTVAQLCGWLERLAPRAYQEGYDNARLIVGHPSAPVHGVLCCLDSTEAIVAEAVERGCNLIVAHHPILFAGTKSLTGEDYVQRTLMAAIKADVAIYAIHTNLDAVRGGVNERLADALGLVPEGRRILAPKKGLLHKLVTFAPQAEAEAVRDALFEAGAGVIGAYDRCSFNLDGTGTFRGGAETTPFVGQAGQDHAEAETRIEVVLPRHASGRVLAALRETHPYEEVAYDLYPLDNPHPQVGAGMIGTLPDAMSEDAFLEHLKTALHAPVVRHTALRGKPIQRVALCGGAGIFLLGKAIAEGADAFVTGDVKYHQFFDADGRLLLADVGHFESEQYTIDLLAETLAQHPAGSLEDEAGHNAPESRSQAEKMGIFAVRSAKTGTNPVLYR